MKRLTTDSQKNNLESALNLFYAKDGEAWVLRGGSEPNYVDVTLFDYIRSAILNVLGCKCPILDLDNEELGDVLYDWLFYGNSTVEGLIATLYTAAWAFAELRERLKMYEDRESEMENPKPLTLEELMDMNAPVWCACKPIEGGNGFWCLNRNGNIVTPSGRCFDVKEIPHWVFMRCKPKEDAC